ncbi:hydrogenase accessory protein HupE [Nostoc sp. NIES-3756]|uniref:HupE/UreJ family protein n=1 Tax=Nostoc sp. NIES-3756 TaxID=1751286 RepID=UPI0007208BAB|nr:HupE/UreJ family protein [Nostoc sp. NIES-3756]BAT52465.1 hydrogenase accessory protein HupE [Nostoc sp. NIES-3756]
MLTISKPVAVGKLQHRHIGAIATLILISLLSSWCGLSLQHNISNVWDGFLWGVADPVLHLNSLVNLLSIGFFSAGFVHAAIITNTFVLASVLGSFTHLFQINLPSAEIAIALFIVGFGAMLVTPNCSSWLFMLILGALAQTAVGIAGLFQGNVISQTISETDTTSLITYTLGMVLTQYTVTTSARKINFHTLPHIARFLGFALVSIGIVFLAT